MAISVYHDLDYTKLDRAVDRYVRLKDLRDAPGVPTEHYWAYDRRMKDVRAKLDVIREEPDRQRMEQTRQWCERRGLRLATWCGTEV